MEAATKRPRAADGSAPDRLTTLPDEIRRLVLSFLPSRQSVQTTVLSKRWVDLWRSVPAINLDFLEFGDSGEELVESSYSNVLVVRAPCLASLCLVFPWYFYKNGLSLVAGSYLVNASISVIDCEFDLSQKGETILVGSLSSVTSLTLEGFGAMAFLDMELDNFPTFDNLRTLSLTQCPSRNRDVQKFMALGRFLQKSPNLEKLTMQDFWYSEGTERKVRTCGQPLLETVRPVVGPIEFPMLENLRTLFLDKYDLRDNFRILRHLLHSSPNLEKLTVRCCELPEGSAEGEGMAKSGTTHSRSQNLVCCQCHKLKSTEIIYKKGGKVQELVTFLLDISDSAPENKMTLTKYDEEMDLSG